MKIPKLSFSHGMTVDELIDWNVQSGLITPAQAKAIRRDEMEKADKHAGDGGITK
jgi:hypothetical protein